LFAIGVLVRRLDIRRLSKNEFGFGITEVIVAIGIVGILIMALTQMILQSFEQVSFIQSKLGSLNLGQELRKAIDSEAICKAHLKTQPLVGIAKPQGPLPISIDLGNGRIVEAGSDLTKTDSVLVNELNLLNGSSTPVDSAGNSVISGDLTLVVTAAKGYKMILAPISLGRFSIVYGATAKNVVSCFANDPISGLRGKCPPNSEVTGVNSGNSTNQRAVIDYICDQQQYPMTKSIEKAGWNSGSFGTITIQNFGPFKTKADCKATPENVSGMSITEMDPFYNVPDHEGNHTNTTWTCVAGVWIKSESNFYRKHVQPND
jgi:hypothetical protein